MIARLRILDPIRDHAAGKAMLLCDATAPATGQFKLQRLCLANTPTLAVTSSKAAATPAVIGCQAMRPVHEMGCHQFAPGLPSRALRARMDVAGLPYIQKNIQKDMQ